MSFFQYSLCSVLQRFQSIYSINPTIRTHIHESWYDSGCYIHRFSNSTWNEIKKQYSACNTLHFFRQWSAMHFQLQDVEQRWLFSSHFLCSWLTSSSQLANRPPPCQAFYPYLPTTSRQRKVCNSGISKNMALSLTYLIFDRFLTAMHFET